MKKQRYENQILYIYVFIGFLIGIVYQNLTAKSQGLSASIFSSSFLEIYTQTQIVVEEYVRYIMIARLIPMILLYVFGNSKWRKPIVGVLGVWTGFLSGVLIVSAVLQWGWKGIVFCLVALIPHGICYAMAYSIVASYLYKQYKGTWNKEKTVFVILMMCVGIILEAYVGPSVIRVAIRML